jgi:hypothetical protein
MFEQLEPDGITPRVPPDASSSSHNFRPFVESLTDAVGLIAFAHYVLSSKEQPLVEQISKHVTSANEHDVDVFRSAAKQCIDAFTHRQITSSVDAMKSQIAYEAYNSIMRSNFDYLLKEQENRFNQIIADLEGSSNVFRQLWIAVAASFFFGLVITGAQFIPNPLNVHWVVSTTPADPGDNKK